MNPPSGLHGFRLPAYCRTPCERRALVLPPLDFRISPYTGLTRDHWCAYADYLLRSAHRHATEDHANLYLPGATSAYGRKSDSLEAFARTFLLASFRIAGDPEGTAWLADWYAKGLDAGTNPANPDRWPTPGELDQAKVEAASLAVGLALTRDVLWDRLPQRVKEQLVAWFETVIGEAYPPINWVWFQIVVECSLPAWADGTRMRTSTPDWPSTIRCTAATAGLPTAGARVRPLCGLGVPVYPQLLQLMAPEDPRVKARAQLDGERLAEFPGRRRPPGGGDGAPLVQGRSLIYRFAAAAPFWEGQFVRHTPLAPGVTLAAGGLRYPEYFPGPRCPSPTTGC